MNTTEIQLLNPEIANDRISMPYPHIELLEPSNAVALVLPSLPKGNIPIICEYQGSRRKIGSIAKSALAIRDLLRVSKLRYCSSKDQVTYLNDSLDIMEVLS